MKANYVRTITIELGTQFILGSFLPKPEKQIVVEDPETIRFDLAYPYPHFDVVMAAQYGTGLVSPKVFQEHSTGATDQGHEYLLSHAVGTGPYVLDTLEPGNQIILTRNEDYWRGWDGPHFDTIIIRSIPEGSTRRQLLESGDVDIAYAGTAEDTAAVRSDGRFVVGDFKNLDMTYIILGAYGPLASPEARQAMNYLFPYDDFLSTISKNTLERANGPFPDLLFTHDPDVFLYDTDVGQGPGTARSGGRRTRHGAHLRVLHGVREGGRPRDAAAAREGRAPPQAGREGVLGDERGPHHRSSGRANGPTCTTGAGGRTTTTRPTTPG